MAEEGLPHPNGGLHAHHHSVLHHALCELVGREHPIVVPVEEDESLRSVLERNAGPLAGSEEVWAIELLPPVDVEVMELLLHEASERLLDVAGHVRGAGPRGELGELINAQ